MIDSFLFDWLLFKNDNNGNKLIDIKYLKVYIVQQGDKLLYCVHQYNTGLYDNDHIAA